MVITLQTVAKAAIILLVILQIITLATEGFDPQQQFFYLTCYAGLFLGIQGLKKGK